MQKRRRGLAPSRVVFASAVTTLMLGTFASFGGLGYAANGVRDGLATVGSLAGSERGLRPAGGSPAADQYGSPGGAVTPPASGGVLSGAGGSPSAPPAQAAASGNLPFTGFPLVLTATIGVGLVILGLFLRRRELQLP